MKIWVAVCNDAYGTKAYVFTKEDDAHKFAHAWYCDIWLDFFPDDKMPNDWQTAYARLSEKTDSMDTISITEHSVQPPKGPIDEIYIQKAQDNYHDEGILEVDDNAVVSMGDEGAYVQAWIWVSDTDITNKNLLKKHGYLNSESRFS